MNNSLQVLSNKRDALLLVEIAAWIHMLGKFHEDFLKDPKCGIDIEIPTDLKTNFHNLYCLLTDPSWSGPIWNQLGINEFQASSLSFFDFIKKHRYQEPTQIAQGLLRLMHDSHGQGSGIEKGVLERFAKSQVDNIYLSTALGTEKKGIYLKQTEWHKLYDFLQTYLQILKDSLTNSTCDWRKFRRDFIFQIESYFRQTVAETRRPLSDVSLFDQTYASVAFLKATLAQNLLTNWKEPIVGIRQQGLKTNITQDKYHWRFIKIGLDSLTFWGNSVRIGDLLVRKELISKALNLVREVIEERYPLGLEVYRDEKGSVFIIPDIANLLDWEVKSGCSLRDYLQRVADLKFRGEVSWTLTKPSDRTRNTLIFGQLATSQTEKIIANSKTITAYWNSQHNWDICPVCSLRPIGSSGKALKLKVCDICCTRRINRAKDWTENLSTTIWIDEVADTNGRLALIVGSFEIESWLTGEAFNSIVSSDPKSQTWYDPKSKKSHSFDYQNLFNDIQNALGKKRHISNTLLDALVHPNSRGIPKGHNQFQPFYDLQVTYSDLGEDPISNNKRPEDAFLLALAIMRQNPSFARLRRVWETTKNFWQEVIADVPNTQLPKVKCRLIVRIRDSEISRLNLVNFRNYDLVFRNIKISILLWENQLITTDNLCYIAKQLCMLPNSKEDENTNHYSDSVRSASFIRRQLLNQQVSIEESTGYGTPNKLCGHLEIDNDVITLDFTEYSPVIQILAESSTFIALVPANNVNCLESLNIVRTIKTKYELEMGKVRNRLPLHLGIVYFDRRTPLRSALDAGRQMLTYKSDNQKTWQVRSISKGNLPDDKKELACITRQFEHTVTLELTQDDRTITWYVPSSMGDGTHDNWYPYVFVKTTNDSEVDEMSRKIKSQRPGTTEPCWLVHAEDLKGGEDIYFTPSTFDFEYLDSTARRFEIHYDENGRRPRPTRPFYLEDLERFDKLWKILQNLESSQCHQVIYIIEATREMWYGNDLRKSWADPVFDRFVTDTLANAAWPKNKQWRDIPERQQLVEAGVRGELADLADLYMEILKER